MEDRVLNPSFICPVGDTLRFSAKGNHVVHSCVAILLRSGRPVAIVKRVALRVFSTLNAVIVAGRFTHVRVEVLKGQPSLAHSDASAAIVVVRDMVRVAASLNHATPAPEDWQVRKSVCSSCIAKPFGFLTSATNDVTFSQVSTAMNCFAPTFAMAKPVCSQFWANGRKFKNCKFTEDLASQVFDTLGYGARLLVSHLNLLNRFKVVRSARALQRLGCSHFSSLVIRGQR